MNRITIDISGADSREKIHDILSEQLSLPDYYGRNLDSLHDILSTAYIKQRVQFDMTGFASLPEDLMPYGTKILQVFTDISRDTCRISDCSIFVVNRIS